MCTSIIKPTGTLKAVGEYINGKVAVTIMDGRKGKK
jgi:hypothetical protein